jgi:hypothetical protein
MGDGRNYTITPAMAKQHKAAAGVIVYAALPMAWLIKAWPVDQKPMRRPKRLAGDRHSDMVSGGARRHDQDGGNQLSQALTHLLYTRVYHVSFHGQIFLAIKARQKYAVINNRWRNKHNTWNVGRSLHK